MNGNDLKLLRNEAMMSRESLSQLLDISLRTMINWENQGINVKLGKPYILALRAIFESRLLKHKLQQITKAAYAIAPSRYVSIWLVCGYELMLMRDVAYHAEFIGDDKFLNDEIRKSIREKSLIVYPLKHNKIVNLAGEENIRNHPGKSKTESDTQYFKDGVCKSILHIPFFSETEVGARPAALLVLEEIEGNDGEGYNEDKIVKLKELLIENFSNGIGKICKALDFYRPLYCDYKVEQPMSLPPKRENKRDTVGAIPIG